MSDEVKKYHEEDEIGKTYDLKVARRLFCYLRPYWKMVVAALALTLITNVLISTQPLFTKIAVDDFITPKRTDGIWLFALAFFGVFLFRFVFSYAQEILLNNVGQRVMFDLRTELFTKLSGGNATLENVCVAKFIVITASGRAPPPCRYPMRY